MLSKTISHRSFIRILLKDGRIVTGSYYSGKMSVYMKGSYFYSINTYMNSNKLASLSFSAKKETIGTFVTNEKLSINKSEVAWIEDWDYME